MKSDCSCWVGRLTYCEGWMMPSRLSATVRYRPSPQRSAAAAASSSSSSVPASRQSSSSAPGCRPIIE